MAAKDVAARAAQSAAGGPPQSGDQVGQIGGNCPGFCPGTDFGWPSVAVGVSPYVKQFESSGAYQARRGHNWRLPTPEDVGKTIGRAVGQ